jgi:membrane-associated protease RseP (regulator of RpoE activity)
LINILLLLATIATTLVTGYLLAGPAANPWLDAVMFSVALLSILGAHEMGHKLTANRHRVEATYPYFIPGIPPLPTFGAVIQQKSLPPNKDALFDLGISGPLIGFLVTLIVTILGLKLSVIVSEIPPEGQPLVTPLLFDFLSTLFGPTGKGSVLLVHPVAYAGYIGMIVTMLNLLPVGQLDGGHIAHVLFGNTASMVLSTIAIVSMLFISWPMALIAYFVSRIRHPGSLDEVSQLSSNRKLAAIVLVVIFILSVAPIAPINSLF